MLGQSRIAGPRPPKLIVSFAQYKANAAATEAVSYDPFKEALPRHLWYSLDHGKINKFIEQCCVILLRLTGTGCSSDTEITNLHAALEKAKIVPHSKPLCVVFLGEQGTGKSSLLCSVLDRDIVDVSSSSSACTAFPTIITHKVGAKDDAKESDVCIEYLGEEEIRECIEEQAKRYRFAFPRKLNARVGGGANILWALGDDFDNEEGVEEAEVEDSVGGEGQYYEDEQDCEEEEDDGEEKEEESEAEKQQTLNSAQTARDFFHIIFNADQSQKRSQLLENTLRFYDIEDVRFTAMCVRYARQRLVISGAQSGLVQHKAIPDEHLAGIREGAGRLWPLVKSVKLETGHALLRNNLSFLDLPGYGDDNQIRTALVEKFRKMADFEVVVAPSQRIVTSVTHNEYLARSTRRLGARNTLLVANKSDQLLGDLIPQGVNKLQDAPFPDVKRNLKHCESLLRARVEDQHLLRAYRSCILGAAGSAYVKREEQIIERKLRDKNVEVDILLVSARQYSLCREAPYGPELPVITAEATGIPRLRQYLYCLPTQTNYETLQYHVYETLPDILRQVQRVLNKFVEDVVYAEMRVDLATTIPKIQDSLESAIGLLVPQIVAKPWDLDKAEDAISYQINCLVNTLVHPTPYYATFLKIIKENGIPVNGKGKGRNLNKDILHTMESYIHRWYNGLLERIGDLAASLEAPVRIVVNRNRSHLENLTDHPALKSTASDALETMWRRIGLAQDKLRADLGIKLRATYVDHTTEHHIKCPIALAMRPVYHSVLDVKGGPGAYARHREHLHECLVRPKSPMLAFPRIMAANIANTQLELWTQCSEEYVLEVMALLKDFRQVTDELLDTQGYVKAAHREVRDQLQAMLPAFEASLEEIQIACPLLAAPERSFSNKRRRDDGWLAEEPY